MNTSQIRFQENSYDSCDLNDNISQGKVSSATFENMPKLVEDEMKNTSMIFTKG